MNPFISVLIPAYNCSRFIGDAIDSVWKQEYANLEIIVVDDGSTDNLQEVLKNYPSNLKYFHKAHSGISASRNLCLEKAQGDCLAFLDADDYWLPGKLNNQVEYMAQHPECEIVFSRYRNVVEVPEPEINKRILFEKELEQTNKRYLPSALIRRDVFEKAGRFLEELQVGEDTEMISRMTFSGIDVSHCIDTVYYCRRLHGNNSILVQENSDQELKKRIMQNFLKYKLH
jgi:glycosyltransferase involved in cell wall biosynthesis